MVTEVNTDDITSMRYLADSDTDMYRYINIAAEKTLQGLNIKIYIYIYKSV